MLVALGVAATSGCRGLAAFDISRPVPPQRVQGDPLAHAAARVIGNRAIANPFELNIDLASEAQAQGVAVQRVFLRSLTFTVTPEAQPAGDSDCFDFVESVSVYAESTRDGTSLPRVTIAEASNPGCVPTLALTVVPDVDLKPYIEEGVRIGTIGSGIPPADDITFDGQIVIRAEPF